MDNLSAADRVPQAGRVLDRVIANRDHGVGILKRDIPRLDRLHAHAPAKQAHERARYGAGRLKRPNDGRVEGGGKTPNGREQRYFPLPQGREGRPGNEPL